MICASEVGAVTVQPELVIRKGRLEPGKMLLIDTAEGRLVGDDELKRAITKRYPFGQWLEGNLMQLDHVRDALVQRGLQVKLDDRSVQQDRRLFCFGLTLEQLQMVIVPMVSIF